MSILVSGTPLALIDNIDEPLRSPRLCSAITQDTYRGRLLGGNRLANLSTKLVWFASGNNLRLHDDLNPRALLCYLLPDTDRPEDRQFDRDLKRWTLEQRHRLAPAAITVLRAYIVAGSPAQNLKGFGSAPDWSALVRSALVWLGRADPVGTQNRLRQTDPVATIKFDMKVLRQYDVIVADPIYDTMAAHFIAHPHVRDSRDGMGGSLLGYTPVSIEELSGKKGKNQLSMKDIDLERIKEYAAEDADITLQLKGITDSLVEKVNGQELLKTMEFPLIHALTEMEYEGINLDVPFLEDYSKVLAKDLYEMRDNIYKISGVEFNIDSPKQMGDILFEHLKIPYEGAKTKTGQYQPSRG